jgi:hypothetical protein
MYMDVFLYVFNNKGTGRDNAETNDRKVRNNHHIIFKSLENKRSWSIFRSILICLSGLRQSSTKNSPKIMDLLAEI